jgi:hypothetical protein
MAGDQSLFAPAFTATDAELDEMVSRFAETVRTLAREIEPELEGVEPAERPVTAGEAR